MKRNRLKLVSEATRPIFGIAPVMQGQLSISGSDKVRQAKEHISAMDFLFHVKPGEQQEWQTRVQDFYQSGDLFFRKHRITLKPAKHKLTVSDKCKARLVENCVPPVSRSQ